MHFKLHLTIMHNIYLVPSEVNSQASHTCAQSAAMPAMPLHPSYNTRATGPGTKSPPSCLHGAGSRVPTEQAALNVSRRGIQVRKDRSQHEARQLFSSNEAPSNARGLADSLGGAVRRCVHTPNADSSAYNVRLDAILGGTARPVNSRCLPGGRGGGEEARYSPVPPPPPPPAPLTPCTKHSKHVVRLPPGPRPSQV